MSSEPNDAVDWVEELELEYPIEVRGDVVSVVRFRRPKRADVLDVELPLGDDGSMRFHVGAFVRLAERLSDQLPHVWKQMDGADAFSAAGVAAGFFGAGPTTS